MFQSQLDHNASFHYESYQKFAEPINSQLNQIYFVCHQELNSKDKHLQVNGTARLDKYFFQNLVKYNEQPYGELVAANFFELDFSPHSKYHDGSFNTLLEKIVLDLTLKVLQVQQVFVNATSQAFVPNLPGLTPPVSPAPTPGVAAAGVPAELQNPEATDGE